MTAASYVVMPPNDRVIMTDDRLYWPWEAQHGVFLTPLGPRQVWPEGLSVFLGCRHPAGAVRAADGACWICLTCPYGSSLHLYEYAGQLS